MDLEKVKVIAILGDVHTGKTNLMFWIVSLYKKERKKYLYGYPIEIEGFQKINTLTDLTQLTDSIILMDELEKHIKFYQRRTNDDLLDILSTIAHNNNTLIFTTPMSQFITKALDCFIDCYCYTKIRDLGVLKNGSKAKRNLQGFSHPKLNRWNLNLKIGEYFEYSDTNEIGENGVKQFKDMKIGKDWKTLKK